MSTGDQTMRVRLGIVIAVSTVLSGCSTTMVGGPKPPFDPELIEKSDFVDPLAKFKALSGADNQDDRNREMNQLIGLVDARFVVFVRELTIRNTQGTAAAKGLVNVATIAGTLTDSRGVKNNWLALTQFITGTQLVYDETYLGDKPLGTVIAQMKAGRNRKLLDIRQAMLTQNIGAYPGQLALADIYEYYFAGTPIGATTYAQTAAEKDSLDSKEQLRALDDATDQDITDAQAATRRLFAMVQNLTPTDEALLKAFLVGRVTVKAPGDKPALLSAVRELHNTKFRRSGAELIALLNQAGIKVP